jgi:hypothetical protein
VLARVGDRFINLLGARIEFNNRLSLTRNVTGENATATGRAKIDPPESPVLASIVFCLIDLRELESDMRESNRTVRTSGKVKLGG